jgi:class 3 adenylate cyclase/predicted ATPase
MTEGNRERLTQRRPVADSEITMSITEWLCRLGLAQYASAFAENAVDWQILPKLSGDDLREIGVVAVGHRRRLLEAIAALSVTEIGPLATAGSAGAERRQLTVMFCDLVGSTALATRLDPEDLRDLMGAYHAAAAEEVRRFDGFVAKYMGDGMLVYFGYPQAHEDDAERAIRAGLGLIDRVNRLAGVTRLEARIGIATGLVVVGDLIASDEGQERGVVGETPNLAARLQGIAEPNTVMISEVTRRLVGDLFEYRDLGSVEVKGFGTAVPVWQVQRASTIESRFEALHAGSMTPLVGRKEELDLLQRRWARAKSGQGQVVLLSGEPGIGKSRLSAALQECVRDEPHARLRYFCSLHRQNSALYPFISQVERAAGFERGDTVAARLDKLETLLAQSSKGNIESGALFANLLGLAGERRYPPLPQDPQRRRDMTLAALLGELEGLAQQRPILLIFEDAQWADSSSLELLDRIIERAARLPMLLILAFRPEFSPPWVGLAHVTSLSLNRLPESEAANLVIGVTGRGNVATAILNRIIERTDGVPLFIEELTKSLIEGGLLRDTLDSAAQDDLLAVLAIPSSLQDSLMARLEQPNAAKRIAQLAAVIGREFSYELLREMASVADDALQRALRQLVEAGLIFQRGEPPRAHYVFKHALIQDAAYQSLLKAQRRIQHRRLAETLERQFPEVAEKQPELIAHHYTEAGLAEPAVIFWRRAGDRAVKQGANLEAVHHLRQGLEVLDLLPAREAQAEEELRLLIALGPALMATMTTSAPEIRQVYGRAQQLARDMGKVPDLFATVWGSYFIGLASGNISAARRFSDELFSIAQDGNDRGRLLQAHHAAWPLEWVFGDLAIAHKHAEAGLDLYCKEMHSEQATLYGGHDPAVCGYTLDAIILQILGYPDRSLAQLRRGLALARELAHPPTLIHALWFGAELHFLRRDPVNTAALVDEWLPLVEGYSSSVGAKNARMLRGWAMVVTGKRDAGLVELRDGLNQFGKAGATLLTPYRLGRAAAAFLEAGEFEEGLKVLSEAIQIAEVGGERWYEAELYRLRGLLLQRSGARDGVEACFEHASTVARSQGALLFQLRAAIALSGRQCRMEQLKPNDALLSSVYNGFTEGFDIRDLMEAKELLNASAPTA